jgi:hypothetical protein
MHVEINAYIILVGKLEAERPLWEQQVEELYKGLT